MRGERNWKLTVWEKMNALKHNETWEIVEFPKTRNLWAGIWVFTLKCYADGNKRYKVRLIAKGFTQIYGIDY